jgi:gliding motility-associated-like protein
MLVSLYAHTGNTRPAPKILDRSDLVFAENKNQWAPWVKYMGDLKHGKLILEQNKMSFLLNDGVHEHGHHSTGPVQNYLLRIAFSGANPNAALVQTDKQEFYRNYFLGKDSTHWASHVQTCSKIVYKDIYPGIDAEVFGAGDNLKYQFRIRPGADPANIVLQYEGAENMSVKEGNLTYATTVGSFTELAPVSYQKNDDQNTAVKCRFKLDRTLSKVTFDLGGYDHTKELVIDPTLVFASYTGSTADNWGFTAAYDNTGNFYAGGIVFEYAAYIYANSGTGSYPTTTGAFQTSYSGSTANGDTCDIALSKFDSTGAHLLYSTYLGGNGWDWPHSLIVNSNNDLYILGSTLSTDFPVTAGAFDQTPNGNVDIIVTKMNATGTALLGSTYVGGSGDDGRNLEPFFTYNYGDEVRGEIMLDSLSNVYIASSTKSINFPVTGSAFQQSNGGGLDGCVFKMNSSLTSMIWASYLGGSARDAAYSVKLDHNNNLIVTGPTESSDFPTTPGTLHPGYLGGDCDGYVCKISSDGITLQASTFIGTAAHDQCFFSEIDAQNQVYLVGQTLGTYPVSNAAYSHAGANQFIQVLDNNLTTSIRSTTFGNALGQVDISPTAFLVDNCGNIYVAGWGGMVNNQYYNPATGNTTGLPVTSDALQPTTDGSDMYFIVFQHNISSLLYATFYGGTATVGEHVDGGTCRFDKNGTIYSAVCSGCGGNSMFPATPGAWSTTNNSLNCNYSALKFEMNYAGAFVNVQASPRAVGCVPLHVQFISTVSNVQNILWNFGDNTTSTAPNPVHTYTDTGHYNIWLIGTDTGTCNTADTAYLDVWVRNDSLSANFSDSVSIDCYTRDITLTSSNYPTTQYLWNFGDGTTSTINGTVSHTYTGPGAYTVNLTVTDTSKCTLQASYSLPVVCPPVVKLALQPTDTVGCIPLTIDFGNATMSNGIYHWDFGDGDTSTQRDPVYTYTHGGHYTVTLTLYDSTSCNKYDTLILHVFAIDSSADASFITTRQFYFCDSVHVHVQSNYTNATWQKWDFGDGFTSTASTVSHSYRGFTFDTITHILYDSTKICRPYDTARIIISLSPLQTSVSVPDTIGCLPFDATLYGVSPLLTTHYYWYFPGGDTAIGSPVSHVFSPVGSYRVLCVSVDSNACVNVDSEYATIVVINDSVHAGFSVQVLNSCDSNLSINLINTSTNALQYYWSFGNGNTSTAVNPSQQYFVPGTYTIKLLAVDTNRCHPRDSMYATVTLKPNAIVNFTLANICLGQTESFVNESSTTGQFVWSFGDGTSSTLYSPTHTYTTDGTYPVQLVIKDTSTCDVYDTLKQSIIVYGQPIAAFTIVKDTVLFGDPVLFSNTSRHYNSSVWNFGDGDTSEENSPTHIYDHTIDWQVVCLEVYNQGAPCRDTVCDSLYVNFVDLIGVPNAFSPNGDGVNDIVFVEGKGIISLDFRIFNRWGQQVYYGTDQKNGWDGTYKGESQPMEVYTYTVDATLINKDHVKLKGNITLLR